MMINKWVDDLSILSKQANTRIFVDRRKSLQQINTALTQLPTQYPILVGPKGSGRTTCVMQLAHFLEQQRAETTILRLNFAQFNGQSKEACSTLLMNTVMELTHRKKEALIVFDELELIQAKTELWWLTKWAMNQIKQTQHLKLLLVTTVELCCKEFNQEGCVMIELAPTTEEQTFRVLQQHLKNSEVMQWLPLVDDFEQLILTAAKQLTTLVLPGAAFTLLERVISHSQGTASEILGAQQIQKAVGELVAELAIEGEQVDFAQSISHLTAALSQVFLGQEKALQLLQQHLPLYLLEYAVEQPLPFFVFHGPAGVDKYTAAQALHQHLYKNKAKLVEIDLSQYTAAQLAEQLRDDQTNQLIGVLLFLGLERADSAQIEAILQLIHNKQTCLRQGVVIALFNEQDAPVMVSFSSAKEPVKPLVQLVITDMPKPINATSLLSKSMSARTLLPEKLLAYADLIEFVTA